MSINRIIIVMDENWGSYAEGHDENSLCETVKNNIKGAEILLKDYRICVIDIGKKLPEDALRDCVYDAFYVKRDNDNYLL